MSDDERLDVAVASRVDGLSRSRAAALIKEGRVTVDGVAATRPSAKVSRDATLHVDVPEPTPAEAAPQDLPLVIVYEDEHLAIINKAAGMVVHPGAGHPDGTLVNALLHHLSGLSGIGGVTRPGIVHRLDRGTSGLLVVAKHDEAHRDLSAQFAAHSAGRVYLALCHGAPAVGAGTVRSRLARHPHDRLRFASTDADDHGREAVTHWQVVGRAGTVSLLRCALETGRTHQVRVHLSEQGWPIVGDALYARRGVRAPARLKGLIDPSGERPFLHAWRLHLRHPADGRSVEVVASPPADMLAALDALELSVPA